MWFATDRGADGLRLSPGGVLGMTAIGSSVVEVHTGAGSAIARGVGKNRELVIGRSPFEAEAIFDEIADLGADAWQARLPRNAGCRLLMSVTGRRIAI